MEKIDDFLEIPKNISKKKRRFINASKWRSSIPKVVIISTLHKSKINGLLILSLETEISTLITKQINVAMIDADAYCIACKLKETQFFTISIRNLDY